MRRVLSGERGEEQTCEEKRAEKARRVFTDPAFREVHDEDCAGVHEVAEVPKVSRLADDVSDEGSEQKLADLVLNRCDRLLPKVSRIGGVLLEPEAVSHIDPRANAAGRSYVLVLEHRYIESDLLCFVLKHCVNLSPETAAVALANGAPEGNGQAAH